MATNDIYSTIFDEIPIITFIVDSDVRVQFLNAEAKKVVDLKTEIYNRRGGEVLSCVYSTKNEKGCGHAEECKSCLIRNSVGQAAEGKKTFRQQTALRLKSVEKEVLFHALITTAPFVYNDKDLFIVMVENVNDIMTLKEMIPICCNCKKVREDDDYWMAVEQYVNSFIAVDFSYSICPECVEKLYPKSKKST